MRFLPLVGLAVSSLAATSFAGRMRPRDFSSNDYYILQLTPDAPPEDLAQRLGLTYDGPLGELACHHVYTAVKSEHDVVKRALRERKRRRSFDGPDSLDSVLHAQKQQLRKPMQKRIIPPRPSGPLLQERQESPNAAAVAAQKSVMQKLSISDPIFHEQWHLFNLIQPGHDINVTGAWLAGVTGKNTTVAIVDDGLDMYSNDLKANYYADGSYDFNDNRLEPKPMLSDDRHGTRCAGEVAAAVNDVCGIGVAYDAKVSGIRILSKLISDADEAIAMNYDFQHNDIYSCSWGPPDDGKSMDAPGVLIRRAMLNGIQNGRGSLGSIYVFASGNGAASEDNCNFDGYTNSIYSITVGAVDRKGQHPYYSELCSAQLVVTYSSGSGDAIHTTDVGPNQCYNGHGGTSAAAPLAAGIFALALQVRPDLGWRDMQYIAMETAIPIDPESDQWQKTSIGKKFSHTFGYGKIDSYGLVEKAKVWEKVKPQAWYFSPWLHVNKELPQGEHGLAVTFNVTEAMLKEANLEAIEHVTVTMNVKHGRRGDLSVDLISPDNLTSHLSTSRKLDASKDGYNDWTFMTVAHWGEKGVGEWTLLLRDTQVNEFSGTFTDWHLKLWGLAIDASKATLLPMPDDKDDDEHTVTSTATAPAATVSLPPATKPTVPDIPALPTDHPERPTKPKPEPGTEPAPSERPSTEKPSTEKPSTEKPPTGDTTENKTSWLPAFLPTFGASGRALAWIYGAFLLITSFVCCLGTWLWIVRRRRLRNDPRGAYEFEILDEDETEGLNGTMGEKTQKRRGGELYNAFAGGSEDEDDEYADEEGNRARGRGDLHETEDDEESDGAQDEKRGLVGDRDR